MRWGPIPAPAAAGVNFVEGLATMCTCACGVLARPVCVRRSYECVCSAGAGDASLKEGIAIHVYSCNASMGKTVFYNSDGDYLIGACIHPDPPPPPSLLPPTVCIYDISNCVPQMRTLVNFSSTPS